MNVFPLPGRPFWGLYYQPLQRKMRDSHSTCVPPTLTAVVKPGSARQRSTQGALVTGGSTQGLERELSTTTLKISQQPFFLLRREEQEAFFNLLGLVVVSTCARTQTSLGQRWTAFKTQLACKREPLT